jgi:hypothetical protein
MAIKYEVYLPKNREQLAGFFQKISKENPVKHYIIRIFDDYLPLEELVEVLQSNKEKIERFRKNKSVVLWIEKGFEEIPDFIPVAPTEEEALDIIDFEEIERDLGLEDLDL